MFNYKLIQLIIATFWMLIAFSYLQYFITEWTKAYFLGEFGGGSHKKGVTILSKLIFPV